MSRPLYDLTAEFRALLDEIEAADGVLEGDLEARLDAISGEFSGKIESCIVVARALDVEAEAIKAEEQRLAARRKAREAQADRLRAYVLASMKATSTPRLTSARFTISIAACPPKLVLVEGAAIPDAWTVVVPESRKPDNASIKAALVGGADLPFATLERGERLNVR